MYSMFCAHYMRPLCDSVSSRIHPDDAHSFLHINRRASTSEGKFFSLFNPRKLSSKLNSILLLLLAILFPFLALSGCDRLSLLNPSKLETPPIIWEGKDFYEGDENIGSLSNEIIGMTAESSFNQETDWEEGIHYEVKGLPAGLRVEASAENFNRLKLSLLGQAHSHQIGEQSFSFIVNDKAFVEAEEEVDAEVKEAQTAYSFQIRFGDWISSLGAVELSLNTNALYEDPADRGNFSDENALKISILGGNFLDDIPNSYIVSNPPLGISADVDIKAKNFTMILSGQADHHTRDESTMMRLEVTSDMISPELRFIYQEPSPSKKADFQTNIHLHFGETFVPSIASIYIEPDTLWEASANDGTLNQSHFEVKLITTEKDDRLFYRLLRRNLNYDFIDLPQGFDYTVRTTSGDKSLLITLTGNALDHQKSLKNAQFRIKRSAFLSRFIYVDEQRAEPYVERTLRLVFGNLASKWGARQNPLNVYDPRTRRIWLIGGQANGLVRNDVWWSQDGMVWNRTTESARGIGRAGGTLSILNNRMWILGGEDGERGVNHSSLWSIIGLEWKIGSRVPWTKRRRHTATIFKNKIWIMGGFDRFTNPDARFFSKNDVWSSSDGIEWNQVTSRAKWVQRNGHTAVAFKDKIWIMGGKILTIAQSDVWSSVDGHIWNKTAETLWKARFHHTSVVFDNKIWVMGGNIDGRNDVNEFKNDVWSSADGRHWEVVSASAPWSPRENHASVVLNNRMWLMGGYDGSSELNDIWWSTDGRHWTEAEGLSYPTLD